MQIRPLSVSIPMCDFVCLVREVRDCPLTLNGGVKYSIRETFKTVVTGKEILAF